MMKELRQHYPSIHRIKVLFYDETDSLRFREVEVREGDALLVDSGKKLQDVLSQIDVNYHNVPSATTARSSGRPSQNAVQLSSNSHGSTGFTNFQSPDGTASMLIPTNWVASSSIPGTLVSRMTANREGQASMNLYCGGPTPLDDVVALHEAPGLLLGPADFHVAAKRAQDCNGVPGLYFEATSSLKGKERTQFVRTSAHTYSLTLYSTGFNDSDMNRLFSTMVSSLRVR
jgi:hypothetical protein